MPRKSIHANPTDLRGSLPIFLSLLPPTDFRCFPTDLEKNVIFFLSWIVHMLIILVDF
jgi:hypothetical protein